MVSVAQTKIETAAESAILTVKRHAPMLKREDKYRSQYALTGIARALISLDMLNPDADGDGKVSAKEADMHSMLKDADVDKDGNIDIDELYSCMDRMHQKRMHQKHMHLFFKRGFTASLLSNFFLITMLSGMMAAMIVACKDLYAEGVTLADGHGSIIGTREARAALYLTPVRALFRKE
jgi:hypothetical protein